MLELECIGKCRTCILTFPTTSFRCWLLLVFRPRQPSSPPSTSNYRPRSCFFAACSQYFGCELTHDCANRQDAFKHVSPLQWSHHSRVARLHWLWIVQTRRPLSQHLRTSVGANISMAVTILHLNLSACRDNLDCAALRHVSGSQHRCFASHLSRVTNT